MNRVTQLIEKGLSRDEAVEIIRKQLLPENRIGLSADCQLDAVIVLAISMEGKEHPCDRCNMDRDVCRGFPRLDTLREFEQ